MSLIEIIAQEDVFIAKDGATNLREMNQRTKNLMKSK